jgi:hypothetical protein
MAGFGALRGGGITGLMRGGADGAGPPTSAAVVVKGQPHWGQRNRFPTAGGCENFIGFAQLGQAICVAASMVGVPRDGGEAVAIPRPLCLVLY